MNAGRGACVDTPHPAAYNQKKKVASTGKSEATFINTYQNAQKGSLDLVIIARQDGKDKMKLEELQTSLDAAQEEADRFITNGGQLEDAKPPLILHKLFDAGLLDGSAEMAYNEMLLKAVQKMVKIANEEVSENNASVSAKYFLRETMETAKPTNTVATGFEELDRRTYGGLRTGLAVLGGVSAVGKTTFALQMAENMAKAGKPVLFFSLEMSQGEMIGKGISRRTYEEVGNRRTENGHFIARNLAEVTDTHLYQVSGEEEKRVMQRAVERYQAECEKLYIYEGFQDGERVGVRQIKEIVAHFISETEQKPVIFIDYLQILAPSDIRMTDKQATDQAIFELKNLSRAEDLLIIAISSFNRDSYIEPISMTSFKESGAIEYTSDYLLGLQPAGYEYTTGEKEKDRIERLRNLTKDNFNKQRNGERVKIELKLMKNRKGAPFNMTLDLVHRFNAYLEEEGAPVTKKESQEVMNAFSMFDMSED